MRMGVAGTAGMFDIGPVILVSFVFESALGEDEAVCLDDDVPSAP